jgi:non-heme chloroperoxidase
MNYVMITFACLGALIVGAFSTALTLIASPPRSPGSPRDIFGFESLKRNGPVTDVPPLQRYAARDGEELAYRLYESSSDRILIFIHGSSYHGGGYHELAKTISATGVAKVILPNLRGHYLSGRHRGDLEYIGQYEDDISDLIQLAREQGLRGPVVLGGHSSGGGLAIRFAGGANGNLVSNYLLLSPIIPTSPVIKGGTAGGWSSLHMRRLFGLLFLNALGIHGFDALPVIEFNKPATFWDGTETLQYSYRLNSSYHPHYKYADDVSALGNRAFVLVGSDDEAIDAKGLKALFSAHAPTSTVAVLPSINHFGIFTDPAVIEKVAAWLSALPTR